MAWTDAEKEHLKDVNHVSMLILAEFNDGTSTQYLHSGAGDYVYDGNTYKGATSFDGNQLVYMDEFQREDPTRIPYFRFGVALKGNDVKATIRANKSIIKGTTCKIKIGLFDPLSDDLLSSATFHTEFEGKISNIEFNTLSAFEANISFYVESKFSSGNFPISTNWNPSSQKRDYAGDKGLDFMGVDIQERIL